MLAGDNSLKKKLAGVLPFLNEKQRRILVASEAKAIGRGGIQILSEITGLSRTTIRKGIQELMSKKGNSAGIRTHGGGRKRLVESEKQLRIELEKLIEPTTRGDPETTLRWTCRSVRNISEALAQNGIAISHQSVANILAEMDYSLQGNRKTKEGKNHPDRDAQFKFINKKSSKFIKKSDPVISVDTKKKELVGLYKNRGREWRKKERPLDVNGHDFPDPKVPKAIPYGVYDIGANTGWVNVGVTADTAEFAVESIRHWWRRQGRKRYSKSKKLLICADCGGSNGYRSRLWKAQLQEFSNEENISVSVCHFPPGTSKWNKIEHRLFSFITMNWRGKPLTSYQVIVNLIGATTTKSGLTIEVRLDKKLYKKGIKIPKELFESINLNRDKFHGDWNYTIKPNK